MCHLHCHIKSCPNKTPDSIMCIYIKIVSTSYLKKKKDFLPDEISLHLSSITFSGLLSRRPES